MKSLIGEFVQESVTDDNEARKFEHQNAQEEVGRKAALALALIGFLLSVQGLVLPEKVAERLSDRGLEQNMELLCFVRLTQMQFEARTLSD